MPSNVPPVGELTVPVPLLVFLEAFHIRSRLLEPPLGFRLMLTLVLVRLPLPRNGCPLGGAPLDAQILARTCCRGARPDRLTAQM